MNIQLTFDFLDVAETPAHAFRLRARTLPDLAFPVPTFQPTQPNSCLALDLHPTGTPTPSALNGITWFDACDADVMTNNTNPVGCARLAIRTDGAWVGYVPFNGAPLKPLIFGINGAAFWGVNYNGVLYPVADNAYWIGSPTNRVQAIYMGGGEVGARLAALEARLAAHGL